MAVKCVTDRKKDKICRQYLNGYTHDRLAELYDISRRTVARILLEEGVLKEHNPYKAEEKRILKLVREFGLSPAKLRSVLLRNSAQQAPRQKARRGSSSTGLNGQSKGAGA